MKFQIDKFKVDVLMNSSSVNHGENIIYGAKATKKENQGFGIISGEKNNISYSEQKVLAKSEEAGTESY
ncbi:hypothetical protein FIU87_08025 [Bacillus sp. THAF10]|uniref:hypothetical protein n=1 Tax=Bacillus sp. THAF10 TaxID=2587848 RepID=UPI00126926D1|nr:hypothetical protein [Bacillus sp. THAF10]QFT88586.1 hypothetical protein FIU87_08025 [Bacillus sp. THAF10]